MNKKNRDKFPNEPTITERVVVFYSKVDDRARSGVSWAPDVADFYMELYPDFFESGATLESDNSPYFGDEWFEDSWD
ncbi:MAG: hypothetical protein WC224_05715 [Sphaerochaetaceae bacterium]